MSSEMKIFFFLLPFFFFFFLHNVHQGYAGLIFMTIKLRVPQIVLKQ